MNQKVTYTLIFIILTVATGIGIAVHYNSQQVVQTPSAQTPNTSQSSSQQTQGQGQAGQSSAASTTSFTVSELAKFDGKGGNRCLLAISGNVYEILDSSLWQEGEHVTSGGQAMCGLDLTQVITRSPHGQSKLTNSKVTQVGTLVQ